jgi:hypothetical protein
LRHKVGEIDPRQYEKWGKLLQIFPQCCQSERRTNTHVRKVNNEFAKFYLF